MLKNYFKIAVAVLKRRKFFTFISLFGISFTLTILIVLTAFVDNLVSANYPEINRDKSLYITYIEQQDLKNNGMSMNSLSYYFLEHYAASLKAPSKVAIASSVTAVNTYINNKKLVIGIKYTNEAFWDVIQYRFLEGKPYSQQQISNGERAAVISEQLKKSYFGDAQNVIGKYIEADNMSYRISGVVKNAPVTMGFSYADMFLPYTVSKTDYRGKSYMGDYNAVLLANSQDNLDKIRKEYANVVSQIPPEKGFNQLNSYADSYITTFTRTTLGNENNSGIGVFITAVTIFVLLFMLLPTLNLVNINITRIMERSSEIGVRKAFGASSKTLVYQFIVENLILTILGGLFGIVLSFVIIQILNRANLIANLNLSLNFTVLLYSLAACVFFGLLSGVYPAWRMSKLNVVTALKS